MREQRRDSMITMSGAVLQSVTPSRAARRTRGAAWISPECLIGGGKNLTNKKPHTKLMNVSLVRSRPLVSAVVVRCSAPVRFPARHNRSRAAISPSRSSSSRSLACTRILSTHSLFFSLFLFLSLSFFLSLSLSFSLFVSISLFRSFFHRLDPAPDPDLILLHLSVSCLPSSLSHSPSLRTSPPPPPRRVVSSRTCSFSTGL